jgi:hypothetical protein
VEQGGAEQPKQSIGDSAGSPIQTVFIISTSLVRLCADRDLNSAVD